MLTLLYAKLRTGKIQTFLKPVTSVSSEDGITGIIFLGLYLPSHPEQQKYQQNMKQWQDIRHQERRTLISDKQEITKIALKSPWHTSLIELPDHSAAQLLPKLRRLN